MQIGATQGLGGLIRFLPRPPRRIDIQGESGFRVGQCGQVPGHPRIDPGSTGGHVFRLGGEPLHQVETGLCGDLGEILQRRPRPLWVDVVRCQWGNATPIVHTRAQQCQALLARNQIGRGLDPHIRTENQSGHRNACHKVVETGIRGGRHRGVALGAEVLHNDFLDVAEFLVQATDRMQGVSAFGQRLPDTDQQTGGERNGQPACVGERAKPHLRILVRAAVVGKAPCFK